MKKRTIMVRGISAFWTSKVMIMPILSDEAEAIAYILAGWPPLHGAN